MADLTSLTDEELVLQYKNGNRQACDIILERYKPLVSKLSTNLFIIGGEKEDLIQEGMIGLFKAIQGYESESGVFFSFASICIKRQMIRAIEISNRKKHGPLNGYISIYQDDEEDVKEEYATSDSDPEHLFIEAEATRMRLSKLIESLSSMEKEVFDIYMDGKDYHEIAQILNKTDKSIDNCMQRIKAKAKILPY